MTNTTAMKTAPTSASRELLTGELTAFDAFRAMEHALDRFLGGRLAWPDRRNWEEGFSLSAWAPACNIYETNNEILVRAELPQVKRENIGVTFENNVLTLRGERQFDIGLDSVQVHRVESHYGNFMRSFTLPQNVDASQISAEFKDGVLAVRLPKRLEARPKQVEIKSK